VAHVRAERNAMTEALTQWTVELHFSFQDDEYLYLVMTLCPGGEYLYLVMTLCPGGEYLYPGHDAVPGR
jgi:serine/threonine protein kinase